MSSRIETNLQHHFGFSELLPGQQEVIQHLLDGHSSAAVFPTGGGKSLCYQLPALLLPGVTLVVSPLIALMKDQIDALTVKGISASRLDSSLTVDEYTEVVQKLKSGELRLLYVAPERFNNERFRAMLKHVRISLFAVDEAHCISEWGHNFRPDYLKLAGFARQFAAERILALTATATPAVLDDICRGFEIKPECAVRTGFYRPNLSIETTVVEESQRDQALLEAIGRNPSGAAIIYVTLQKTAEKVAQRLADAGLPARAYHAGLKNELRSEIQEWFMASTDGIVVATIAFGMGIDKANIRAVYHYNLPKSLENYSQEIGRAGRDGVDSICQMLACPDDLNVLENFVYGDTPDRTALYGLINESFAQEQHFDISLYSLSFQHDIRHLVLRTLLTYLELDGYLQGGTPFYSDYKFKPLKSSAEILSRFEGERRQFLANLFRHAVKSRVWLTLDPAEAATALHTTRDRIIQALDWLGEQQLLEVKVAGIRLRFQLMRQPDSIDALVDELYQRIIKREEAEIHRLQQVVELITMDGCQSNALASHFGEQRETPCGHCSWCRHGKSELPSRRAQTISDALWKDVEIARREHAELLEQPRMLSRFLCGITSPRLSRSKLTSHSLFGRLESVSFKKVLIRAQNA
jgi:ATP-dependent DNA helicase RecQ